MGHKMDVRHREKGKINASPENPTASVISGGDWWVYHDAKLAVDAIPDAS